MEACIYTVYVFKDEQCAIHRCAKRTRIDTHCLYCNVSPRVSTRSWDEAIRFGHLNYRANTPRLPNSVHSRRGYPKAPSMLWYFHEFQSIAELPHDVARRANCLR